MSVVDSIKHYQRSIEKYPEDEKRLLHCITKLENLPITVNHLQETGIGRTINSFRKNDGAVGQAARILVGKWKELVAADSSDAEEGSDGDNGYEELQEPEESNDEFLQIAEEPEDELPIEEYSPPSKSHKSSSSKHENFPSTKHEESKSSSKKHEKTHHDNSENRKKHKESNNDKEHHRSSSKREMKPEKSSSDDHKKHKKKSHKSDKERDSKKHETHKNDKYKLESSSEKHKSRSKLEKSPEKSSKIESSKQGNSSSSSQEDLDKYHKKKNHEIVDKISKKDCDKKSKNLNTKEEKSKHKSDKKDKSKHRDKSEASTSKPSKSETSSTKNKRKLVDIDLMAGAGNGYSSDEEQWITSHSGTSFADALGGGMSSPPKKKVKISTSPKPKLVTQPIASPLKCADSKPDLLTSNIKLAPLNLDITLPAITPNYQPLPNSEALWDLGGRSTKTEEEALSMVMVKNNLRTKVYSGNKVIGSVPSLFDICIRILQDNIDALAYTGGVPYDILFPILERCTPEQLFAMEHHNAYLLEDTDGLWGQHCKREFRGKRRDEFETWREAYSRFLSEREEKLKALTANIKQTIKQSVPIRQTKLAYVDSVVKPPRGIARKQAKYGTASASASARPSVTPASRASAVANSINVTAPVLVPNPGARASGSSNHHGSFKPKKAPLMQKTLALIKSTNRYRR